MIKKWTTTIPQLSGNETRNIYLYLPTSYGRDPGRRYPVLYMFDGHNVFFDSDATYGKSWGLGEYLDYTDTPLIVAAVECNHSPDGGRLREYSPYTFSSPRLGRIHGEGKTTMEWLVRSLKEEIDRDYATRWEREYTFIAGSSMGGLMSLYALLAYNTTFSRAAALSPSLWTAPSEIENLIRRSPVAKGSVLYMDYGAKEDNFRHGMDKIFDKIVSLLLERNIALTSRIVPDGTHCEASWQRQLPFMIHTLMYGID